MKNSQKGFAVQATIAVIAVLVIGGVILGATQKKVEAPIEQPINKDVSIPVNIPRIPTAPNIPNIDVKYDVPVVNPPVTFCTADAMKCPDGSYVGRSGPKCEFVCPSVNFPSSTDPDWKNYSLPKYGIEFKYPTTLNSKYASVNSINNSPIIVSLPDDENIDGNGCYMATYDGPGGKAPESTVYLNSIKFCLSLGGGVGAGQLYRDYVYTTFKDGKYFTLSYLIHTPNGCGAFMNNDDKNSPENQEYRDCLNAQNNYDNTVLKTIQESVSSFKFTN